MAYYPIGKNISAANLPITNPAVAQTASAIRAASADTTPIYRQGNPYNASSGQRSYITADNKMKNSPSKSTYTYYGVPTLASRSQLAQQELQQKQLDAQIGQWQQSFNEQHNQNQFNNAVNAAQVTHYAPKIISDMYPAWSVPAHTYGLAADVAANPGVQLYIPGQTQLKPGDIFLGGTGTGVTDDMLGGATRIAGTDSLDTANLFRNYLNGLAYPLANG